MAKDFDAPMGWTKKGIETIVQSEIHEWENRMQASEDATVRCTGGHGDKDEVDDIVDAAGSALGYSLAKFPLSFIWVGGSLLIGIGTERFLESIGWGLITLVMGWVLLNIGRNLK